MASQYNWLTVREVASELQVHEETVRRWIRNGELSALKFGGPRTMYRVRPADLSAFMRQHTRSSSQRAAREPSKAAAERPTDFRHIIEQLPLVTFVFDPSGSGTLLYISPEIEQIAGVPVDEWYQDADKLWPNLLSPGEYERLIDLTSQLRMTREHFSVDVRMVNRETGAPVWVSLELETDLGEGSDHDLWYGLIVDITDRKLIEERLRAHVRLLDSQASRLGAVMSLERMIFEVLRDLREGVPASLARFRLVGAGRTNLTSYALKWPPGSERVAFSEESAMEVSRAEITRSLLTQHVLATEQSVWATDLRADARFSDERELLDAGARGAIAVPVRDQVRVVAVLEVAAATYDAFHESDRIFLEAAGSIAGLALARQGERWFTVPDVAEALGVRPDTVRRWIRNGALVATMPGGVRAGYRIDAAHLDAFVLQRQGGR
ncbi:hypothetical protein BH23CHL2_BH23CHL2_27440 [soil metagenome]